MRYSTIFFDLDGTLTDPGEGITNSVMHALKKYGIEGRNREEFYSFIGPPLHESFGKYLGCSEEESLRAVEYYREYYRDRGIFENRVYDGIPELLERLKNAGYILAVASSKPEVFVKMILEHYGLEKYFDFAGGALLDGSRVKKADVISHVLNNLPTRGEILMVGDREHDVLGAADFGMDCLGVTFGYGSRQELENAGAKYIADSPEEIGKIIFSL